MSERNQPHSPPPGPLFSCQGADGACAEEVSYPPQDLDWYPLDELHSLEGLWLCEHCADAIVLLCDFPLSEVRGVNLAAYLESR